MNGGDAIVIVVDRLEAKGLKINGQKKAAIGGYAKRLLEGGAATEQVKAWAEHYGARLAEGSRIRPSQAWEDVTQGINAREETQPEAKDQGAARRISQALGAGIIARDAREPLEWSEQVRARRIDQELRAWRNRCDRELEEEYQ